MTTKQNESFKSLAHGNMYLKVDGAGYGATVSTASSVTFEGQFYIENLSNGKVAFRSVKFQNYLRPEMVQIVVKTWTLQ